MATVASTRAGGRGFESYPSHALFWGLKQKKDRWVGPVRRECVCPFAKYTVTGEMPLFCAFGNGKTRTLWVGPCKTLLYLFFSLRNLLEASRQLFKKKIQVFVSSLLVSFFSFFFYSLFFIYFFTIHEHFL